MGAPNLIILIRVFDRKWLDAEKECCESTFIWILHLQLKGASGASAYRHLCSSIVRPPVVADFP